MYHELTINQKFPTLNEYIRAERSNKYCASQLKKQYTNIARTYAELSRIKIDKKIDIEFIWGITNKKSDPDNIAFGKKFILDGFVDAGLLENDGHKQVNSLKDTFEFNKTNTVIVKLKEVLL